MTEMYREFNFRPLIVLALVVSFTSMNAFAQEPGEPGEPAQKKQQSFLTVKSKFDVINNHIQAVGGVEALKKVKTVTRSATGAGESPQGAFNGTVISIADVASNRVYQKTQFTGYIGEMVSTGKSGWMKDNFSGQNELPANELELLSAAIGPSALINFYAAHGDADINMIKTDETFNDSKCIVLNGNDFKFYINVESNLLEGYVFQSDATITFQDYASTNDLKFATKETHVRKSKGLKYSLEYTSTKLNTPIDEAIFNGSAKKNSAATAQDGSAVEQIISHFDKNDDKKISNDEATGELKQYFSTIDANADGMIDMAEAQTIVKYQQKQADAMKGDSSAAVKADAKPVVKPPTTAKQVVESMDKNNDGKINKDEADEDLKLFFSDLDTNNDDSIDEQEAIAIADYLNEQQDTNSEPAVGIEAAQLVKSMDKNSDGKIDKDEAPDQLKENFQYIDTNSDGVIDVKEAQKIVDYLKQQGGK